MSRWFVGSSSSSRSGCDASARASDARVSSPPEKVCSGRSRSSSVKPSPRTTAGGAVAPVVAARVLEPSLRLRVAPQRRRRRGRRRHRFLEHAQLLLDGREVGGARRARTPGAAAGSCPRGPLVVQRDARALLPGKLPSLERDLARQRAQERRLAGPVRAGQREPVGRSTLKETPSKRTSPENSLRRPDAITTAMSRNYPRMRLGLTGRILIAGGVVVAVLLIRFVLLVHAFHTVTDSTEAEQRAELRSSPPSGSRSSSWISRPARAAT